MKITKKGFENEHLICNDEERLYLYRNSTQIQAQTGYQGYLRGDFDHGSSRFFSNFFPCDRGTSEGFSDALQDVMEELRKGILSSYRDMQSFCYSDGFDGKLDGNFTTEYAFRVDHKNFAFLFRLIPAMGDYHVYCFCYRADWLTQHMTNAERGIRFITPDYSEKFRLRDGASILITYPDAVFVAGREEKKTCRFIDDYHVEIGASIYPTLYHICEYAEVCERNGLIIKPENSEDVIR